ncbi:EipB family protein [Aureimonas jatrophae]|uniref:DUF1849 family protein n=1 Tax=Aureimonas jatrophae TaxID=1166073 RepID=A0A1H0GWE5_9HYPH|nr:DUF1849 family protein [Aureimonas jatrophae]MBB3949829.1 hypothetical protein [Aureimonas jatrophae]SDO11205.1 protein of unknown function [Aureimonas jatrophae]
MLLAATTLASFMTQPLLAAELRTHEAVYDLKLAEPTDQISAVDARIALQLTKKECDSFGLDYRFVARFHQDDEVTVTDQSTRTHERTDGSQMTFTTQTLVDGTAQERVEGKASTAGASTTVIYSEPVQRESTIPSASFPLQHIARLIERAEAGERIVEAKLFDGDAEAEKGLTTTSIITSSAESPTAAIADAVRGLKSWLVTESYYNADSDDDGQPIFETRYRLFENGVSDELVMNFGAYTLEGRLTRLSYLEPVPCTAPGRPN